MRTRGAPAGLQARGALVALVAVAAARGVGGAAPAGRLAGRAVAVTHAPSAEVRVPAGWFSMGITAEDAEVVTDQCRASQPSAGIGLCEAYRELLAHLEAHPVWVDAFAIDRDEVSARAYRACVAAGGCALDALVAGDERYVRDEWPMVNVTWWEARDFCRWRGGRLPTEAEWERAARGDGQAAWPWGEVERPRDFNHGQPRPLALRDLGASAFELGDPDDDDGAAILAPPGSYAWGAGPFGTRDQAGNVAEWVADAARPSGYDGAPTVNPRVDGSVGDARVVRGGSWRQPSYVARVDVRDPFASIYAPGRRFSHVGFRCARDDR